MWSIRPYQNTDTLRLSKIWEAHHRAYGSGELCTPLVLDQCVLSKPYFRYEDLQVAEETGSGECKGWIHFGINPQARGLGVGHGIVHRLCVAPGPDESEVAAELLLTARKIFQAQGVTQICGLGAFTDSLFYQGISDGDGMLGVSALDDRLVGWMRLAGYEPYRATECREVSIARFRPPMDRNQMAIHRASTVSRILGQEREDWWENVIFGHCERVVYQVVTRISGLPPLELTCWFPELALPGIDPSIVRFLLPEISKDEMLIEQWIYMLGECLRHLQQDRKHLARTVVDPQDSVHLRILQRLGFKTQAHGMLMRNVIT